MYLYLCVRIHLYNIIIISPDQNRPEKFTGDQILGMRRCAVKRYHKLTKFGSGALDLA